MEKKCLSFLLISLLFIFVGDGIGKEKEVVVYTSLDQIYSEPILRGFEKETGIKVKAVYDIEATKTIGLVNRLIAERKRPRCDVFWNNEIVNTIRLKKRGILSPYNFKGNIIKGFDDPDRYWYGFAARCRVIVINKEKVVKSRSPRSILEVIDKRWKKKVCMAYPLFGTTATHMAALAEIWGIDRLINFLKLAKENKVSFVDGNSVVRDKVAKGIYCWGITDTDDVYSGIQRGMPIEMIMPDQDGIGTLFIPNTVSLIKGAPHPENGKRVIEFLLSRQTEWRLSRSGSGQIPIRHKIEPVKGIPRLDDIKVMAVDFENLADLMDTVLPQIESII